ncbi:MAG: citrate synthase [Candidatus Poribacteria bacterium]|nr:citrate synthase [Candidatus Poribacteria bacterium]MDE0504549.1 citrate synthase [Candidatus Poribacteria bacterium]
MPHEFVPGLEGVPIAKSAISFVDGLKGILEYRGIRIQHLAEHSTYEETAHLLLKGELPDPATLDAIIHDLAHHRRLESQIIELIKCLPEYGHPMDALQAAIAALGMFHPAKDVTDDARNFRACIRLIAKLPTIVSAYERFRNGAEILPPLDGLGHSANFLYMLTGEEPNPVSVNALDVCLILHADHTMNASTFSGRVTGSTLADPYTVVSSAVGTLAGPLHGGANEQVLDMLRDIGSVQHAESYIEEKMANKERIMGFGHRVYKTKDPRAIILRRLADQMTEEHGSTELYEIALKVDDVVTERLGAKGIYANVDFYSGIVYDALGIRPDAFTPIFAMGRVAGWLAHWLEQLIDNRIFRPTQIYAGEHDVQYIPTEQRGGNPR